MAILYILVKLLMLNVCFSDVSGIDFFNNTALSKWNSTELETAMITEQIRICPYIALCNSPNSSDFKPTLKTSSPCCQKCSCDYACVEDGSCCPDFYEKYFSTSTLITETTKQLTHLDVNETTSERQICVKTQYGSIPNRDGFTMIASCPSNFQDDDVRRKCETKFDYSRNFDIYDHIPVTDTVSGVTFKNRFCELCNKGKGVSATFWRMLLQCASPKFTFDYYLVTEPNEFAETILLDQTERCNIVFDFENLMIGSSDSTPHYCETDDIISSCDDKNSNSVLQTLCSSLFWPIKGLKYQGGRTYKNYACMLCNGVEFYEWCDSFNTDRDTLFAFSLTTSIGNTKQIPSTPSNSIPNKDLPHQGQVIERYFPNDAGEVHCQKGFVYDSKKRSCRLVLCPLYFYVKDGVCVPIFGVLNGIVYQVLLQADVPFILQGEDEGKVVAAIAASLGTLLRDRLGKDQYEFYIWNGNSTPLQFRLNRQYLIILAISGNVDQGRYISMLKFINNFVLLEKQLSISIENDKYAEPSNVFIRFNTSTALFGNWEPFTQYSSDNFQLVKSYNGKRNLNIKDNGSILYISPTVLCYRVALFENEVKSNVRKPKYISIASKELVMPNFDRIYHNKKLLITVCIDHAFNNIPESVSYIFLNKNETNYKFISKPKVNTKTNVNDNNDIKTRAEEETLSKDSIVPTLATIGVVVFVIVIRQILKRFTTQELNTGSTEETVINMTTVYRISRDDEESNINENRGNISVGNEEELVEPIQTAGNDKEITNDSVERRHTPGNEEENTNKATRMILVAGKSEIIKNESTEKLDDASNKTEVTNESTETISCSKDEGTATKESTERLQTDNYN